MNKVTRKRAFYGKDLKGYIQIHMKGHAESHLDSWKDRYANYGGNKKRMEIDLYTNHDPSLEIESCEEELNRKLTGDEHDYFVSEFNKEVIKQWKRGIYA